MRSIICHCWALATLQVICGLMEAAALGEPALAFAEVSGTKFMDAEGGEILLHGASVIGKLKAKGYTSCHNEADFARLRAWELNRIRLGILRDGLELEPGQYDEAYLKRIDDRIA